MWWKEDKPQSQKSSLLEISNVHGQWHLQRDRDLEVALAHLNIQCKWKQCAWWLQPPTLNQPAVKLPPPPPPKKEPTVMLALQLARLSTASLCLQMYPGESFCRATSENSVALKSWTWVICSKEKITCPFVCLEILILSFRVCFLLFLFFSWLDGWINMELDV